MTEINTKTRLSELQKYHTIGRTKWLTIIIMAILIAIYAIYASLSMLLYTLPNTISPDLQGSFYDRQFLFYIHMLFGAPAVTLGAIIINGRFQRKHLNLHRKFGYIYIYSVWLSGTSGLILAFFSAVGWVDHIGFATLAVLWLYTTTMGFKFATEKNYEKHINWMVRSYSLTFAAVTLRLWMPILITIFSVLKFQNPFFVAYPIISFLCWVPNIIFAERIIQKRRLQFHQVENKHSFTSLGNIS
ncbi:MAG: DUF2306 domain-containing protein [Candidatus Heimdallarchaeota archaeon]|nr:DUF2306 domain-containing protein [Candidatus Heimdallarchaeota archaeon]MDH5647837.1 DUF2306 domain-containing protein [Candidatus Heimdallarchaeota archaeon]